MTAAKNGTVPKEFVLTILPWLIGTGGLLVYLVTLNQWVSLPGLETFARLSGWSERPELSQPLTFIVFYPIRWLPGPWVPLVVNLVAAACAALVLLLLVRTVALLPHDLTPDDPLRKKQPAAILSTSAAWMPPVLAAMICGLQLSFWEHATSASGEMINLMLFAYVIRGLFEFRVDRNPAWLTRCACVYGAAVANDWAMAGCIPIFLVAILRIKGFGFLLDRRLILRMTLFGCAGLSLYLFLPAVHSLFPHDSVGFWPAFKLHLRSQTGVWAGMLRPAFRALVLVSLLLFLVLSILWKSQSVQRGDDTRLGIFLTKAAGYLFHCLVFFISLWMAFDPGFSPRHLGFGTSMLTFYFVSALMAGYCAGYFLVLNVRGDVKRSNRASTTTAWIILCALPVALVWRNLAQVRMTNSPALHQFAKELYADLPTGQSVVLSEDARPLLLLRAELAAHRREKNPLLLETTWLLAGKSQAFMANPVWPAGLARSEKSILAAAKPRELVDLIAGFSEHEPVVYLHPSSGLFLEPFTDQPRGSVHYLAPCKAGKVIGEKLADGIVATNEQIWQQRWTNQLETLAGQIRDLPGPRPSWAASLSGDLRLTTEKNVTASFLGAAYSKDLNYWGVELQRVGRWREAGLWFGRALELNPDNLAARINVAYNTQYQVGKSTRLDGPAVQLQFRDLFSKYHNWPQVLGIGGPVDEPTFLFRTGRVLLTSGNDLQALRAFARCAELAPDWPVPKLWLAQSHLRLQNFAAALELTDSLLISSQQMKGPGLADLLYCRVMAMRGLGRTSEAMACIESFVSLYHKQDEVLSTAADLYAQSGQPGKALPLLDELVKRDPSQAGWLVRKGFAQLQLSQRQAAIETLTQVLSRAPADNQARLYRAAAYSGEGRLDLARADYEKVLNTSANSPVALFELGGIAWQQGDTNAAIQYYRQFLSNGIPKSPRFALASQRLSQMKNGQPP